MVGFCRRLPGGGEFRVHDLSDPLDWLPDASVDLVLCALAYEYADNRAGALREFRRVLKPGGAVVLSKLHPAGDWLRHGGSYFDTWIVEEWWGGELNMGVRFWTEPLEATCAAITDAWFLIERLVEPRLTPAAAALAPAKHERLSTGPYGFIAFRLRPPRKLSTLKERRMPEARHCRHCAGACPGDCLLGEPGMCIHGWNEKPPRMFSWQLLLTRRWWHRVLWGSRYSRGARPRG